MQITMELRRKLTRDTSMKSHLQKLPPMAANLRRDDDDTTTTNDDKRRHDASHANTAPTPRPPTINGNPSLRIRVDEQRIALDIKEGRRNNFSGDTKFWLWTAINLFNLGWLWTAIVLPFWRDVDCLVFLIRHGVQVTLLNALGRISIQRTLDLSHGSSVSWRICINLFHPSKGMLLVRL